MSDTSFLLISRKRSLSARTRCSSSRSRVISSADLQVAVQVSCRRLSLRTGTAVASELCARRPSEFPMLYLYSKGPNLNRTDDVWVPSKPVLIYAKRVFSPINLINNNIIIICNNNITKQKYHVNNNNVTK